MKKFGIAIAALLLIAGGYTYLWSSLAEDARLKVAESAANFSSDQTHDWELTHGGVTASGFPFAVQIHVTRPALTYHGSDSASLPLEKWIHEGELCAGRNVLGDRYWWQSEGTQHFVRNGGATTTASMPIRIDYHGNETDPRHQPTLDDFLQKFVTATVKIGSGSIDNIAAVDALTIQMRHKESESGKEHYQYNVTTEGLEILAQLPRTAPETFDHSLDRMALAAAPHRLGKMDWEFSGTAVIPDVHNLQKLLAIGAVKPGVALRQVLSGGYGLELDQPICSHNWVPSAESNLSFTSDADSTVFAFASDVAYSTDAVKLGLHEQYQEMLTHGEHLPVVSENKLNIRNLIFTHPEKMDPIHWEWLPERLTTNQEYKLDWHSLDANARLKRAECKFALDVPESGYGVLIAGHMGAEEGIDLSQPDGSALVGKVTITIKDYERFLLDAIGKWNSMVALYVDVDPGIEDAFMPPEALFGWKFVLKQLTEDPQDNGPDLKISIDFTDPNNRRIGSLPFEHLEGLINSMVGSGSKVQT
jgi:hypothetical protein